MTLADIISVLMLIGFLGLITLAVAGIGRALSVKDDPKSYPSYGTGAPNDPKRFSYR